MKNRKAYFVHRTDFAHQHDEYHHLARAEQAPERKNWSG